MKSINEKLEIPLGNKKRIYLYVQSYDMKKVQINIYYYSGLPYSSAVDSDTEKFSLGFMFRI